METDLGREQRESSTGGVRDRETDVDAGGWGKRGDSKMGQRVWGGSDRPLRSVGGVAGSDTGAPEAPEAPSPAKSPKLGQRWEAGCRERPFPPGILGSGLARGGWGPGHPLTTWAGRKGQVPSSSWEVGCSPPLPAPSSSAGFLQTKLIHTAAGKGRSLRPSAACAPLQPAPCSPDEGAKGEMAGVVEVKITDPFIKGKKSENPKKKKS